MKSRLHRAPRCSTTKCVRIVGQSAPVRLSTADAFQIVHRDEGEYCTKAFFRDWHSRINEQGRIVDDC